MVQHVEAIYENGLLRLLSPLQLPNAQRVHVAVTVEEEDGTIDHTLIALAKAKVAAAGHVPALDEIRARLAAMDGSMAETIIAERGER